MKGLREELGVALLASCVCKWVRLFQGVYGAIKAVHVSAHLLFIQGGKGPFLKVLAVLERRAEWGLAGLPREGSPLQGQPMAGGG